MFHFSECALENFAKCEFRDLESETSVSIIDDINSFSHLQLHALIGKANVNIDNWMSVVSLYLKQSVPMILIVMFSYLQKLY